MLFMRMRNFWVCCTLIMLAFAAGRAEFAYVLGTNTYVPLKTMIEVDGSDGEYNAAKKTVSFDAREKGKFLFTFGSDMAGRDGKPLKLEAAPFRLDGVTYVPLGALNTVFGFTTATPPKSGFLTMTYAIPENVTEPPSMNHTYRLVLRTLTPAELALRSKPIADADARAIFNAVVHSDAKTVVQLLKDHPELRFAQDNLGDLPLHFAVRNRLKDMVEVLLANGASLEDGNVGGNTPLHVSANPNNYSYNANPHNIGKVDSLGRYPAGSSAAEMVTLLIKRGSNVNAPNAGGMRPLHHACSTPYSGQDERNPNAVSALLEAGAEVNAEDCIGHTALFSLSDAAMADLLLAKGADLNHLDRDGQSALLFTAGENWENVEVIKFFLDHGISADVKSPSGETPLMRAASEGSIMVMTLLLQKGADVNAADNDGMTALLHMVGGGAGNNNSVATVKFLLAHGARVNAVKAGATSPLHCACCSGNLQIVKALLAAGASVNAKDADGKTPLQLAKDNQHPEIVKALVAAGAK